MLLSNILKNIEYECSTSNLNFEISDIVYDSRKIIKNSLFVCLSGCNCDGHKFYSEAIKNGAIAIIAEHDLNTSDVPVIITPNTRKALATMSANFFNNPASEITTIGITGTKGKTTTSYMIKSILEHSGNKVGIIGTIGIEINGEIIKTDNTTPESYEIQKYLRKMVDNGCKYMIMEVSSLGLKWHRTDGFNFNYGIFTNFSSDHIGNNEHENLQEYLECKSLLFQNCDIGLINIDDVNYKQIINNHTCKIITFGFSKNADFIASNKLLVSKPNYLGVQFNINGNLNLEVNVNIPGNFSIYNALAAAALCHTINISNKYILQGLNNVKVKGRVESVKVPGKYTLLIDYAHNAISMENILKTLKEYSPNRLITLFGAGGNRDKNRRYEMGEVSGKLSDISVVTSDNSRFENVEDIISDIKIGISKTNGKYVVIPDRKEAIKYCIENAQDGDIIVLAGKGHEDYQEINGIKHHFDEREIINDILLSMKRG